MTNISPAARSPMVVARHIQEATRGLLRALHYHVHFGHPIDELCPEHNQQRRDANARTVAAHALEAGQRARFSGEPAESWERRCPTAWAVQAIRESFVQGWERTDRDLREDPDLATPSGQVAP